MNTEEQQSNKGNKPTHIVRKRKGTGDNADFETIGMAWDRGDGSFYVKPYGTQIINGGFYVFPIKDKAEETDSGDDQ